MLSMWTTKSVPNSFIHRNCNTSEQGAEKYNFSSVNQNLQLWMLKIVDDSAKKFLFGVSTAKKILQARNWQSDQSWLKNSRHQSLIANWLIKARRFCIITIWCELKMGWNERRVKWLWGEMNVGWNECGVKWMWGEMNVGWNECGVKWYGVKWFGVKWFGGELNAHRLKITIKENPYFRLSRFRLRKNNSIMYFLN